MSDYNPITAMDQRIRQLENTLMTAAKEASDLQSEAQSLEHQRDKALENYERAMHRIGQLESKLASYESGRSCPNCQGWGCTKCCSSDDEIRSRQGIYG